MEYTPPIGGAADDPYVDADPGNGIDGSIVAAAAIEAAQREIVNVITQAGLAPDSTDLAQLYAAIMELAVNLVDSVTAAAYQIGVADGVIVLIEQ